MGRFVVYSEEFPPKNMGKVLVSKEQLSSHKKVTGRHGASQSQAGHAGQPVDVGLLTSQTSQRSSFGLKDLELEKVLSHQEEVPQLGKFMFAHTCNQFLWSHRGSLGESPEARTRCFISQRRKTW